MGVTNESKIPALLALQDGTTFEGLAFGASGTATGEVVFNTGMTGYTEILTDPSYAGQMVCMTYPLIGNYGVTAEDYESDRLHLSGFIVRELSRRPSNWRSQEPLADTLAAAGVIGIEGIDTRALVRHIREAGAMKAALSTEVLDGPKLVKVACDAPGLLGRDLARGVSCAEPYDWTKGLPGVEPVKQEFNVTVLDLGVKHNILRCLVSAGCAVRVVPYATSADEILAHSPDGVLISNGPGDPEPLGGVIDETRKLLGRVPLFGICMGQQILGQALGGRTFKLAFGHHGCNHPVKDIASGRVEITSQNHGFCVDMESMDRDAIEITHVNLNDETLEGFRHRKLPVFAVQYHPEAGPGPHDARQCFGEFAEIMRK